MKDLINKMVNNMKKIIGLSSVFLIIDIILKLIIKNNMVVNESINIINNFFSLTYVKNTGAAWSILSGKQFFLIIVTIMVIISLLIYLYKMKNYNSLDIIGYSLLLAGALGNLIDRIFYGYVIDYLDFLIFNYDFPIFNIADCCIVIGIMILFISSWREEYGVYGRNRKYKN